MPELQPELPREKVVLTIDDDPGMLILAEEVFAAEGYCVATSTSGADALERLLHINPDVILLDIMMPDMDGYEVCSRIKEIPQFEHTPVIVLTGLDDIEAVERAYEVGAWDFTPKPINWLILKHRVRYAMRASRAFVNESNAARLSKTIDKSPSEVFVFDARTTVILNANASALDNLGYSLDEILSWKIGDIAQLEPGQSLPQLVQALKDNQQTSLGLSLRRKNGSFYTVEGMVLYAEDSKPEAFIGIFQDVTEKRRIEAELHRLAYYDELTGLPNRRRLKEQISRSLSHAEHTGSKFAVCLLDLDGFKAVNDTLGHSVGDMLLKEVSDRLCSVLRQYDIVVRDLPTHGPGAGTEIARLGGDEFLILVTDFSDASAAVKVATRVLQQVALPYNIKKHELNLTASMGISVYPEDGNTLDELLMRADTAMYKVKQQGKNNFAFYTREAGDRTARRVQLEAELRDAIKNHELELHYQPQLDSSLQQIVGAEAMLRWRHPQDGLRYPDLFVDLLEETGLILPVGEWVLKQAIEQLEAWSAIVSPNFSLSVNVSSVQVRDNSFLQFTSELLEQHPAARGNLVLELTESSLLTNVERVQEWLREIKSAGVKIAIDDFGTGYSSLSYLKKFPIDNLKVDRSFVMDVETNREDAAIVKAIFSLARSLGLGLTVEGVESLSQLEIMREMGDCLIQGWLVSKALPAHEFEEFVRSFSAKSDPVQALEYAAHANFAYAYRTPN